MTVTAESLRGLYPDTQDFVDVQLDNAIKRAIALVGGQFESTDPEQDLTDEAVSMKARIILLKERSRYLLATGADLASIDANKTIEVTNLRTLIEDLEADYREFEDAHGLRFVVDYC